MEFSVFADRLRSQIGAGSSTAAFTRSIFEAILTDEGQSLTEEYSEETYKAYYNGNTRITKMAQKITAYIEPFSLQSYIDQFSDAAHEGLVKVFADVLPDADSFNIGEQLAGLFEAIIRETATVKRKTASKGVSDQGTQAHDILTEKILASGAVLAEKWGSVIEHIASASDSKDDDQSADTSKPIDAKVIPDTDAKIQIINNPTIVNQNGEKNIHIEHLDVLNL